MKNTCEVLNGVALIYLGVRRGNQMTAYVDLADISSIASIDGRWSPHRVGGTIYARFNRKWSGERPIYMHRMIAGELGLEVDHIDHNGLNNRRYNLRSATKSLNGLNRRGPNRNSKFGLRGVTRDNNKYTGRVMIAGKVHKVGNFHSPENAGEAVRRFLLERPDGA